MAIKPLHRINVHIPPGPPWLRTNMNSSNRKKKNEHIECSFVIPTTLDFYLYNSNMFYPFFAAHDQPGDPR